MTSTTAPNGSDPSTGMSMYPLYEPDSHPPAQRLAQFDSAIAYTLSLWPALTLAITEQWGPSTSSATGEEKRALFAGAISDLFAQRPQTDEQDLEEVLLQ